MAVIQEGGMYDVDGDLCFSYPCFVKNGEWEIDDSLVLNDFQKKFIKKTMEELQEERKLALGQ